VGIHRIPGVRGAQAYLVDGPQGPVVIDPGYTGSARAVLAFLKASGFQPSDLCWVLLTHHHVDHGGTALALCTRTGARLAIHRADAPYLRRGRPRERATLYGLIDQLPTALARFLVSCASGEVHALEDGERVAGLQVIHAPGHTPGSICLWSDQESALFAGDVLNNEKGIRRPPWTVNHDHRQARAAPRRLLGMRYEHAFFGHGPPILEGASARVEHYVRAVIR
jgi:glyoxylase-like metal-dependent hydrolase (beta-lactamase superfamily II)